MYMKLHQSNLCSEFKYRVELAVPLSQSDLESEYLHLSKVWKAIAVILSLKKILWSPYLLEFTDLNWNVILTLNENLYRKKVKNNTKKNNVKREPLGSLQQLFKMLF